MPVRIRVSHQRRERVFLETDRYRIEGKLTLPSEGFRSRLSDYVNQGDREFFSVEDASVTPIDGAGEPQRIGFMLVARRHVRLVLPLPPKTDPRRDLASARAPRRSARGPARPWSRARRGRTRR